MAAIVPVYFTGSPASQLGVPLEKSPQSLTTRLSLAERGLTPSESTMFERESVKAPESEPNGTLRGLSNFQSEGAGSDWNLASVGSARGKPNSCHPK